MNYYTVKEIESHETALKDTVLKFDRNAEFLNEPTIKKSLVDEFDLCIEVEFMGSDGKIQSMGRYLTK